MKPRDNNSSFVRYMSQKWYYQRDITHCKPEDYYLYNRYREHYICFNCRLSSKSAFLSPPKHNLKEWKKAKTLYDNNPLAFTYTSVGDIWDDTIHGDNS